ncbi:MAG TPA: hypothetical protein VH640_04385 [Bryobacteraceae bacterium]|jgi:hypothetical protein
MRRVFAFGILAAVGTAAVFAQGRGGGPAQSGRQAAPFDPTGYWVSIIVDEWRFRVTPQKGDIPYLPINAAARRIAMAWDPDKDFAEGNQCKAYGAVGVMQRPGRLHITWQDDNTLKIEADAGTQTRILHFGATQGPSGQPTWQGVSAAQWQTVQRGRGTIASPATLPGGAGGGTLKIVTTNMLPGYIRKNGVPYSDKAVLTEYINRLNGDQNDTYLVVTAEVEDPVYLNQPFIRSYEFKKQADGKGWNPMPCLPQ